LKNYIKNDSSDIRIIIGDGKPVFAFRRHGSKGSHLNNISAGGSAEILEMDKLSQSLIEDSQKLAKSLKKELCGIDFMFDIDKNHFIFLEANTTPQLVNGIFAEDKLKALSEVLG
jgi:glutathione synthase/RimK-type ligase-like ATP-grasp enzyme